MKTIVIVSSCWEEWGGSEELWARSIDHLHQNGFRTVVVKDTINKSHPRFIELANKGVKLLEVDSLLRKGIRVLRRMLIGAIKVVFKAGTPNLTISHDIAYLIKQMSRLRPGLVVVSQGSNMDGLIFADACNKAGIPYVIVSQKAVDFFWPFHHTRTKAVDTLLNAKKCFFVSRHNLKLTEEQFGIRIPSAQVVCNPIKVPVKPVSYPNTEFGYRLACIGRLFLLDKGQDILLRVLAEKKWQDRPITVTFIGTGVDEAGLKEMAILLGVTNVKFVGFVEAVEDIWREYHALILPSRNEGMPLVVLESMASGRPVIITNAGGNAEIVEDGITGFIGECNESALDQTMERAWSSRDQWELIGIQASAHIAKTVPKSPEKEFAGHLMDIIRCVND